MSDATGYGQPQLVTEGPFQGWCTWLYGDEPFETLTGPFHLRDEPDGTTRCGVLPEARHTNATGVLHGGFLMTFADFAMFAIARKELPGFAVTVSAHSDFVGAGRAGELLEATGEVVRATRSLVFVRGMMSQGATTVMTFSGVLKRRGATV